MHYLTEVIIAIIMVNMSNKNTPKTPKNKANGSRVNPSKYNKLSSEKIAKFAIDYQRYGKGSKAVNVAFDNAYSPEVASVKANRMLKNANVKHAIDYVQKQIDNGAVIAVDKVIELAESDNEQVALNSSKYLINQAIGTPVTRSENKNVNINIDSVLQ